MNERISAGLNRFLTAELERERGEAAGRARLGAERIETSLASGVEPGTLGAAWNSWEQTPPETIAQVCGVGEEGEERDAELNGLVVELRELILTRGPEAPSAQMLDEPAKAETRRE